MEVGLPTLGKIDLGFWGAVVVLKPIPPPPPPTLSLQLPKVRSFFPYRNFSLRPGPGLVLKVVRYSGCFSLPVAQHVMRHSLFRLHVPLRRLTLETIMMYACVSVCGVFHFNGCRILQLIDPGHCILSSSWFDFPRRARYMYSCIGQTSAYQAGGLPVLRNAM